MAVKEPPPPPTLVLSREDGTITANPRDMHELINRCWVEGVFNKKDTSAQYQDWVAFAEEGQVNGLDYQDMMRAWQQHHQSMGGPAGEFPIVKIDAARLKRKVSRKVERQRGWMAGLGTSFGSSR